MPANEKPEFIEKVLERATPELKVGPSSNSLPSENDYAQALRPISQSERSSNGSVILTSDTKARAQSGGEGVSGTPEIHLPNDVPYKGGASFNPQDYIFALIVAALFCAAMQGIQVEQFRQRVLTEVAFFRGADQPHFAETVYDMSTSYFVHRNSAESRLIAERAIAHLAGIKQDKSQKEALLLASIARNQLNAGELEAGQKTTDRVIASLEGSKKGSPEVLPNALVALGLLLEERSEYERASKIFNQAALLFPAYPPRYPADALFHVGYDYNKLSKFTKGEEILRKLIDSGTLHDRDRIKALRALGISYEGLKQYQKAEEFLQQSVDEGVQEFRRPNSINVAYSRTALGRVKNVLGQKELAEQLAESGYHVLAEYRNYHLYDYNDAKLNLANIYRDNGKYDQAQKLYSEMLNDIGNDEYNGPDSDSVKSASKLLLERSGK